MMNTQQSVVDDVDGQRFLYVQDGVEAVLAYRTRPDQLILVHTEVPDQLGGRGIGARLVGTAAERAARTGETVLPWCSYARKWLQEHQDEHPTITIDWSEPPA